MRRWGRSGMAWGINIISLYCKKSSTHKVKIYLKEKTKKQSKKIMVGRKEGGRMGGREEGNFSV